jgi:hypothetical protein
MKLPLLGIPAIKACLGDDAAAKAAEASAIDEVHLARSKGWINTRTGKQFYPLAPEIEKFDIFDQATALSHICRYGGQVARFYTVAMHAIIMSHVLEMRAGPRNLLQARTALTHDNGEAYYGDIVRPLKRLGDFAFIKRLEAEYDRLFETWLGARAGGVDYTDPVVHGFDLEMCAHEAPLVFEVINPAWEFPERRASDDEVRFIRREILRLTELPPVYVAQLYLERFDELFGKGARHAYSSR